MKTKHTPEPWTAKGYEVRQPSGRIIADFGHHHTPPDEYPLSCKLEDEANARRAVACVNACEGFNPEAIKDLLMAFIEVGSYLSELEKMQPDKNFGLEGKRIRELVQAAITKATRN